jgi:hypothetical protein
MKRPKNIAAEARLSSLNRRRLLRPRTGLILGQRAAMIPQIPYAAIGIGIAILLGIWAFIEAETDRGRVLIAAVMAFFFILRILWRGSTGNLVWLIGWMVFGICCLIFIKWRGIGIR